MPDPENFYLKRKRRLLLEFDLMARSARPVLKTYFGETLNTVIVETRREFERLIPQLPYIGGKQPFTEFIIFTGMLLAVYRVGKAHGKSVEQIGALIYEIGNSFLCSYPAVLLYMFGRMNFSKLYLNRLQTRALESQRRKYSDDYVYNFVKGDGKTFDYGVDYIECASCKFLAKQGAFELAPYLCPVDIIYSEALGWGLSRVMTLAEGAPKCDFRFKRGGETNVTVPTAIRDVVSRSR
jgi:hypothetical protein